MANPFLFDDDLKETNTDTFNPFLMNEDETEKAENPFVTQTINPFAEFNEDCIQESHISNELSSTNASDIAGTMTGGINIDNDTNINQFSNDSQISHFDDSSEEHSSRNDVNKKKGPPPRPNPPSQTTQDLIFAVADQLDQASSQMLGRLPATRTPSPVSMRDIHSPSPFPDLVDISSDNEPTKYQSDDLDTEWMGNNIDNPFTVNETDGLQSTILDSVDHKTQPSRPPPPPRPLPPPRPNQPESIQTETENISSQEPDLFDIFGDTKPNQTKPAPKTKEDILSLFSAPKTGIQQNQQVQPDLLSGDIILENIPPVDLSLPPPLTMQTIDQPLIAVSSDVTTQAQNTFPNESKQDQENQIEVEISGPENDESDIETKSTIPEEKTIQDQYNTDSIAPEVSYKRVPTPDIEITTVEDLPRSDDEEQVSPTQPVEIKQKEEEESDQHENVLISSTASSPIETHMTNEPEQMDTGLDFAASIPSESTSANPFASPESEEVFPTSSVSTNIFATEQSGTVSPVMNTQELIAPIECTNIFASNENTNIFSLNEPQIDVIPSNDTSNNFALNQLVNDEFDVFSAKFESAKKDEGNLIGSLEKITTTTTDAWGSNIVDVNNTSSDGFGNEDSFDPFYTADGPELESPENKEFNVVIRPKEYISKQGDAPILAPPPPPPRGTGMDTTVRAEDLSLRINPFDKGDITGGIEGVSAADDSTSIKRTDSQETPCTPLFDEDVSQPLEDFPRVNYTGLGWEMQLRQPNKKKITGQRFWKKIFMRLIYQGDNPVLQLFNQQSDKEPFQELPLQPSYSVSEIGAQQYDQFGKIFTVKLQYIFYKERPGVRPGQVTKAERITNKLSQFAAYAIQGDYQGVKEFGSDLKKLGLPVEHAPQVSQLFKIGSMSYEDLKQFSVCIEEALFKLPAHRDRALNYKFEEVQITAVDEIYVEQTAEGHVEKQIARVRLFFLAFLSGMPTIELGLNDLVRQGKEVVGRHDIIPVVTEEWIRLEGVEFHSTVQQDEYERTRTIKFQPPDACYIELMRFRVRPPKNRELPLQLKATWCVTGNRVELRADVLVPGFASRKLGQIPCEDVAIRFPIPECWIYLFRVEKHFRYGSVKSAHRRTGKIKGIERILGTVDALQESLIEVTSGQAKYEHQHRALVWRCPRLPKEGQGAYTTHQLVCRMALTSYDQIPEQLAPYCYVEFTMPATQVSHTTVRSVSVQDSDSDEPPEKYVRYLARHEYRVGIEHTTGESPNAYLAATRIKEESPQPQQVVSSPMAPSDSDSESN